MEKLKIIECKNNAVRLLINEQFVIKGSYIFFFTEIKYTRRYVHV